MLNTQEAESAKVGFDHSNGKLMFIILVETVMLNFDKILANRILLSTITQLRKSKPFFSI